MAELELDEDLEFLFDGIINGYEPIPADSALTPTDVDNYRSSTKPEARDKMEKTLQEEIVEGKLHYYPQQTYQSVCS